MLIPLKELFNKYDLHPKGVIVVGAHWAEEHEEFIKCGIERFVYIEPCKESFDIMCKKVVGSNFLACNCACGDKEEDAVMFVSHQNQGQSNSLLQPKLHLEQHKEVIFDDAEIVTVKKLDNIVTNKEDYDFLYMDVQGAEGMVLRGATEILKHINIIYTECNRGQTYEGNMEIEEMDEFLKQYGFERVETYWPSPSWTWGDCFYTKR